MGYTVTIKQANKLKRVRTFIKPNGEKINGGAEAHFGNPMGDNLGGAGRPVFPGKGSQRV